MSRMLPPSYPGIRRDHNAADASRVSTMSQMPPPSYPSIRRDQQGIDVSRASTEAATWSPTNIDLKTQKIIAQLPAMANSDLLSEEQKLDILSRCPHVVLDEIYNRHFARYRQSAPPAPVMAPRKPELPKEDTYAPLIDVSELNAAPNATPPIYPPYAARFATSEQARQHRKRIRVAPKTQVTDLERVKRYGRQYWVRRIYDAMCDISNITDGASSIHRQRFAEEISFDPSDLEATAHQLFDEALAVHERGWNRPQIYHKRVVRGKLADLGEKSVEGRLLRICHHLKSNKATVDDALRGGVTLALLCDNPDARGSTKASNNAGNKKRAERLKREKELKKLEEARKQAEKEVR